MCKDRRVDIDNGDWVPVLGNKGARTLREEESHKRGINRPSNTLTRQPPSTDRALVSLFVDSKLS